MIYHIYVCVHCAHRRVWGATVTRASAHMGGFKQAKAALLLCEGAQCRHFEKHVEHMFEDYDARGIA